MVLKRECVGVFEKQQVGQGFRSEASWAGIEGAEIRKAMGKTLDHCTHLARTLMFFSKCDGKGLENSEHAKDMP